MATRKKTNSNRIVEQKKKQLATLNAQIRVERAKQNAKRTIAKLDKKIAQATATLAKVKQSNNTSKRRR